MINRREFLKFCVGIGVVAVLPPLPVFGEQPILKEIEFPEKIVPWFYSIHNEYGRAISLVKKFGEHNLSEDLIEKTVEILREDARLFLPKDTRFEIRRSLSENYGRYHHIAWYRPPMIIDYSKDEKLGFIPEGGFYRLGRFST